MPPYPAAPTNLPANKTLRLDRPDIEVLRDTPAGVYAPNKHTPEAGSEATTQKSISDVELLESINAELERVQLDNQSYGTVFAGFVAAALLVAGGYLAAVQQDESARASGQTPLADWVWAGLAIVPVLIGAYVITLWCRNALLTYYTRELEQTRARLLDSNMLASDTPLFFNTVTVGM